MAVTLETKRGALGANVQYGPDDTITEASARDAVQKAKYGKSRRVLAVIGDSRAAQSLDTRAQQQYINCVMELLGQPYDRVRNFAVGGKTLPEVVAEQLPLVAAQTDVTDLFMDAGVGGFVYADLVRDHQIVEAFCAARGIRLFTTTTMTSDGNHDANARTTIDRYNQYKRGLHDGNTTICLEVYDAAMNIDGTFRAGYETDGLHLILQGAWPVAHAIAPEWKMAIAGRDYKNTTAYDTFNYCHNGDRVRGLNASGTNLALTNISGLSCPDAFIVAASGTITGSARSVADDVYELTITAGGTGSPGDNRVEIRPWSLKLTPWVADEFRVAGQRLAHATNPNIQYLFLNNGSLPSGADQTASWSTTVGEVFKLSTDVRVKVVDALKVTDSIFAAWDIEVMQAFNGVISAFCVQVDAADTWLTPTMQANYCADTDAHNIKAATRVIATDVFTPHASMVELRPTLRIAPSNGQTAVIRFRKCLVGKYT